MKRFIINKIVLMQLALLLLVAATNCSEDDAITYSVRDVSSRISGFGSSIVGAGSNLTVNGTDLDKVVRIAVGDLVVPAREFVEVTSTSLTFPIPGQAVFGETTILFVFPGSERATGNIEVVPLQLISSFNPSAADEGETITVLGLNFEEVGAITASVGGVAATITSTSNTVIQLTVPAGASDGVITLSSEAGEVSSSGQLVVCGPGSANPDCADALNANFSFELGDDDNFDNWGQWNGGNFMTEATAPDKVFRGARSLEVIRDGSLAPDQWRIQLASDLVDTDIGSSYTVYAWVRSTVAGGSMRFSTQPSALYGGDTPIPTTWTRISWTFTANADDTRVMLDMNGAAVTTFYIDDVKLLKN